MTHDEENTVLAQASVILKQRAAGRHEPPFDGLPCPVCPGSVRNLTATVHNFLWRWESGGFGAYKARDKLDSMRSAVASTAVLITDETHGAIRTLHEEAAEFVKWWDRTLDGPNEESRAFAVTATREHGAALRKAMNEAQTLVDAHFADRLHSHGEVR